MDLLYYDAHGRDRPLDPAELGEVALDQDSLLWLNGSIEEIEGLNLPNDLAAAFASCKGAETGVRTFEGNYCLSLPTLPTSSEAVHSQLLLVVGEDWLISAGSNEAPDISGVTGQDAGDTMKGELSGTSMASALLTDLFAGLHRHIAAVDLEIDRVEQRILRSRNGRSVLQVLAVLRRRTARLRGVVSVYRPVIAALARPDFIPLITAGDREHLLHLEAGYEKLSDEIVRLREAVIGSFDLYTTQIAQNTNRLLKALTILTFGIGLIGAGAGIMGMNFKLAWFDQGAAAFTPVVLMMAAVFALTLLLSLAAYRRD